MWLCGFAEKPYKYIGSVSCLRVRLLDCACDTGNNGRLQGDRDLLYALPLHGVRRLPVAPTASTCV